MKPNFLYRLATFLARPAAYIYFKKRNTPPDWVRNLKGPAIMASNHPNSFFDTVVQGAMMKEPGHTVVRGDVFKKGLLRKIFNGLHMIPAYRGNDGGREHVLKNDELFELCRKTLKNNGIIYFYPEGLCVHEYKLRPLKKGLARVAMQAFLDPELKDKLRIIPTGLNYTSFAGPGKSLEMVYDKPITIADIGEPSMDAASLNRFNVLLESRMKPLTWQEEKVMKLHRDTPMLLRVLLFAPALLGWLCNAPFYYPLKRLAAKLNQGSVFYDSMLFGFLILLYPLYYLLFAGLLCFFLPCLTAFATALTLPLWGWCAVRVFKQ